MLLVQLSVSVYFQRLKHNLAGETGIELPNSLFDDLPVCFDRIAVGLTTIFVRDLDIACVHDLLRKNELSLQVSFTKHARSEHGESFRNFEVHIIRRT